MALLRDQPGRAQCDADVVGQAEGAPGVGPGGQHRRGDGVAQHRDPGVVQARGTQPVGDRRGHRDHDVGGARQQPGRRRVVLGGNAVEHRHQRRPAAPGVRGEPADQPDQHVVGEHDVRAVPPEGGGHGEGPAQDPDRGAAHQRHRLGAVTLRGQLVGPHPARGQDHGVPAEAGPVPGEVDDDALRSPGPHLVDDLQDLHRIAPSLRRPTAQAAAVSAHRGM